MASYGMDASALRTEISAALAADLGTYVLPNGEITPAISVRPEGQALAAGTVAAGLEVVILAEPRLSPVGAYLQQEAIRKFIVFLVGWDDSAETTVAAEKLVYTFPGTIWQEIPIAKRVGPTNQARVIIQSPATPGLLPIAGPRTGASNVTLVITGTATGSSGGAITGASALVLTLSGVTVGAVAIAGVSDQVFPITATATGVIGSISIGSSSATLTITGSAAGSVVVSGASSEALAIGLTTDGVALIEGISSQVLTITGLAAGVIGVVAVGASSATLAIAGTSSGAVIVTGASAQTLALTGSATSAVRVSGSSSQLMAMGSASAGTVDIIGASSQAIAITGSADGVIGAVAVGASSATLAIVGISTGAVSITGDSAHPLALTGPAAATISVTGSSNQSLTLGSTSAGSVAVAGASSQVLDIAGSAEGVIGTIAIGTSSVTLGITGSSDGTVLLSGSSGQSLAITGTATAAVQVTGDSAQTFSISGTSAGGVQVIGSSSQILEISGAAAGTASNPIVIENALSGVADSTVGFSTIGSGTNGFYSYAKQFSRNVGESIGFAVDGVNATNIAIHRIGHYGGLRWRLIETISNTPTNQPDTEILPNSAGARSAANWSTTATWNIPANAVSGLYVAVVRDAGNVARSWIPFIVREDGRTADIVLRISDTTWGAAYNTFGTKAEPLGGKSVYGEGKGADLFSINLRGVQMSYDRPIVSRGTAAGDNVVNHWDNHESALIDWVEKNGFDVKYISCYDLDQGLTAVGSAKVLACAGHDEYWSDGMLDNTEAFIAAGGHHVSMSANSQFWRIRWADSGRTFYCYKDTMDGPTVLRSGGGGTALDPVSWTGTWRDTRWGSRRPENLLLGATFRMNGIRDETMVVNGAANQAKPFWRNTTVASGTNLSVSQIIGFEADSLNLPNAGGVDLGSTSINIDGSYADDNGQTYNNNGTLNWGIACHYPRPEAASGLSIHFSTNQWMWGLSDYHRRGSAVNNREMRQATYNLFTDLGAVAVTKESDLTTATPVALSTYGATRPSANGTSTATLIISGSATGVVRVTGASSQVLTITGNASGSHVATGSSSQSLAITGSATGTVRVTGSSVQTLAITGNAAGTASGGATGLLNSSTVNLAKGTTSKTASIGFTPTAGNKLVAICCAAATFTVPSGWTRLARLVDVWESVVFTKTSNGTETTMSWTQNGARQARVTFLEFPASYTITVQAAWAKLANIQAAINITSGTVSPAIATYIYARCNSGYGGDFTSHTYTTTTLTEISDGGSGTNATNDEAVHTYVAYLSFANGPRTVSWTMTPSTGVSFESDALQLVAAP